MSHSKNNEAEKSYDNGSVIETFTGKTNIKKLNGNNLMEKKKTLKNLTTLIIWVQFHNNVPRRTVSRRISDFKKSNISNKTDIY